LDALGWNCLLIEAIPEKFEACKANRPHAKVVHAALGAPGAPAEAEFTVTDDHWGGMLSYLTTSDHHLKAVQSANTPMRKVRVPGTTMDNLLKDHAGDIAAAVIDVEGGEVELLKGFDLARHRPRILLIEDQGQRADSPLGRYMQSQPYQMLGWLPQSRIYIRSDLTELRNRALQLG
jgi:FkbM family methyltransferase